jgi:hypothetical protein
MRRLLALALILTALPALARAAEKPPCLKAEAACTEWVALGDGQARSMIYRTYPLGERNTNIRRVLIMVHGTGRNADHYFTTATGAAFLAGALGDTLVISPAFHSADRNCGDKLQPNEVSWSCGGTAGAPVAWRPATPT